MMTFSENDLLPYNEIKLESTPECLKTCLMQWILLDDYVQETGGFVTDVHPDTLANMCSLDMGMDIGASDFLCMPQDFKAGFEQSVNALPSEAAVERKAELNSIVTHLLHPGKAAMKVAVEKLINDELKGINIPESKWTNATLRSKATILANYRLKQKVSGITRPADYYQNPSQYEFCVHLNRLIGGKSITSSVTKLYFQYDIPFEKFEIAMQTETQLCVIPPDANQSPNPSNATGSSSYTPLPSATASSPQSTPTSTPTPSISARAHTAYGKKYSTYFAHGTTWVKASLPLSRAEKGYTVKDGPWLCKISAGGVVKQVFEISDEASYKVLLDTLQNYNKAYPDIVHSVVIMHSKEREIWDKSTNDSNKEWHESRKRSRSNEGFDEDEDTLEETYFEWLCRAKGL